MSSDSNVAKVFMAGCGSLSLKGNLNALKTAFDKMEQSSKDVPSGDRKSARAISFTSVPSSGCVEKVVCRD